MPLLYDSKAIIPAPFVTLQKELVRSEDGKLRRRGYTITLKGKLTAFKGSPNSQGTFWTASGYPPDETITIDRRLAAILAKQGALTKLFKKNDGKWLEIQPLDGSASTKCLARVRGIEFAEGNWVDSCPYTITLETDKVYFGGVDGNEQLTDLEPEETWGIELANEETRTYRLTHTVSSQQRATYASDGSGTIDKQGWENARSVVTPFLGQSVPSTFISDITTGEDLTGYVAANYGRSENIDESAGKYTITESWVYVYGGKQTEVFTISTKISNTDGTTSVSIEGTITGFYNPTPENETPNVIQGQKYDNANSFWGSIETTLVTRCQNYSGVTLNPTPLQKTVGRNPVAGVITYNYEFDDRPTTAIAGAKSETISVTNDDPADVFARIVILGRAQGPLLQPIGTITERVLTVAIEAVMPRQTYGQTAPTEPNTDSIIGSFTPAGSFVSKSTRSWVPKTGRYSRTVSFTWE